MTVPLKTTEVQASALHTLTVHVVFCPCAVCCSTERTDCYSKSVRCRGRSGQEYAHAQIMYQNPQHITCSGLQAEKRAGGSPVAWRGFPAPPHAAQGEFIVFQRARAGSSGLFCSGCRVGERPNGLVQWCTAIKFLHSRHVDRSDFCEIGITNGHIMPDTRMPWSRFHVKSHVL